MDKIEFIIFGIISVFIASALTFSLARRYPYNRKMKFIPAGISLFLAVNFGIRALITEGTNEMTYMIYAFFALIACTSSITSALSVEKSKE